MIVSVAKGADGKPVRNWGAIPIVAVLLPLIDFALKIGPPRPVVAPLITSAAMLGVLFLIFRFSLHLKPKTLSRLLALFVVAFCLFAIGYIAADAEYVSDKTNSEGRTERVVLGYDLKSALNNQIKTEADAAIAEHERERDPLQNATSFNSPPPGEGKDQARDADKIAPFKTEDQIRDERISQMVNSTGDPAAPFTESSIRAVTYALLLLWVGMLGCLAACVGILTVASKLVLRRGALAPKPV
ncbi:MAG: hypothetical protein JO307_32710 [Bryobacterales bacterium]|nr:hypothetical protein [Bryobacterales bacterium]MBV9399019.1 hypothetical protein [Bryobacterales bacterium]